MKKELEIECCNECPLMYHFDMAVGSGCKLDEAIFIDDRMRHFREIHNSCPLRKSDVVIKIKT